MSAMSTEVRPQDNRGFTDTNTAQKLTEEDIRKMKSDGKGGRAIIQASGRVDGLSMLREPGVVCLTECVVFRM